MEDGPHSPSVFSPPHPARATNIKAPEPWGYCARLRLLLPIPPSSPALSTLHPLAINAIYVLNSAVSKWKPLHFSHNNMENQRREKWKEKIQTETHNIYLWGSSCIIKCQEANSDRDEGRGRISKSNPFLLLYTFRFYILLYFKKGRKKRTEYNGVEKKKHTKQPKVYSWGGKGKIYNGKNGLETFTRYGPPGSSNFQFLSLVRVRSFVTGGRKKEEKKTYGVLPLYTNKWNKCRYTFLQYCLPACQLNASISFPLWICIFNFCILFRSDVFFQDHLDEERRRRPPGFPKLNDRIIKPLYFPVYKNRCDFLSISNNIYWKKPANLSSKNLVTTEE